MLKLIDFKAMNGKLLRLKIDFDKKNNKINSIRIAGDFFVYPEEAISSIEDFFKEKIISIDLQNKFNEFINENNIQIIGFSSSDLMKAIKLAGEKNEL